MFRLVLIGKVKGYYYKTDESVEIFVSANYLSYNILAAKGKVR